MDPSGQKFIDELCTPRLLPLTAAFATALLISWLLDGYLDTLLQQRFSIENRFVDGASFVSHRLLEPREGADFTVVMLGGSVTREAALPETELHAQAQQRFGMNVAFLNLASSSQTLGESLGILDTLALPGPALVVQQFSFKVLDFAPRDLEREYLAPRITGMRNAALSEGLSFETRLQHALMPTVLLYRGAIASYLSGRQCHPIMLLARAGREFCFRPIPVRRSYYAERDRLSAEAKADYVNDIRHTRLAAFRENRTFSMNTVERIVRLANARGMNVVLVNPPVDPAETSLEREADRAGFAQLARQAKALARYVDLRFRPEFSAEDFRDSQHLLDSGKEKYSAILLSLIDEQLGNRE